MTKMMVELVKYDMDKTKKRKRKDFIVDAKTQEAIIDKLERIHKGEKVQAIHEVVWGEEKREKNSSGEVLTGTIKFFDSVKGFGFIQPNIDSEDLFFHASSLGGEEIYDDDPVYFQIGQGPKGAVAVKVKLIKD
tara:strand:- start:48 stop:449 length:402 start_codon:yes stop_codon:yes gene_type:complete